MTGAYFVKRKAVEPSAAARDDAAAAETLGGERGAGRAVVVTARRRRSDARSRFPATRPARAGAAPCRHAISRAALKLRFG